MPIAPRIPQAPDQVVYLNDWPLDEDFPFGPQGAKAKRIFVCPNPPPFGFLIGGHRYIFKEPSGTKEQQVWSEVIAYELGKRVGVAVPPAFLAGAPGNGSPGVLIEYFYGHAGDPEFRLVHAIERLQAREFETDLRRGSLQHNIEVCRIHNVDHGGAWWAQTLSFDALIGNTDRHSENWGFLVERLPNGKPKLSMAPAYDNGTSLGYIIQEAQLEDFSSDERLLRFINGGRHHVGWESGDARSAQHIELCKTLSESYPQLAPIMRDTVSITDSEIDAMLRECTQREFSIQFTERRAIFVGAQIRNRRDALLKALGG